REIAVGIRHQRRDQGTVLEMPAQGEEELVVLEIGEKRLERGAGATEECLDGRVVILAPAAGMDEVEGHRGRRRYEIVKALHEPRRIAYERLVDAFWHDIDPTQADGQFCDHGPEYHTAIFYRDSTEYRVAAASRRALERRFEKPIVTAIVPATAFYPAEPY